MTEALKRKDGRQSFRGIKFPIVPCQRLVDELKHNPTVRGIAPCEFLVFYPTWWEVV
jgi:hypothetical protein